MKKLLLASAVTLSAISAMANGSFADVNEQMKNSKYCETNSADVLCMGPESVAMRTAFMAMTKEKAIESRTKYCQENAGANDPICDEKMMNDTTGY
jgi:hypothetical protein